MAEPFAPEAHITRLKRADEIPAALRPRVHVRKSNLPFFKLLPT